MPAIEVQGLEKSFGKFRAVRGVSFTIREGSVAGFVGPNGAGKTTTIKSMATLVRPDRGSIKLLGKDPFKDKGVFREVSFVFSKLSYPPTDTVKEYLEDMASVFGGDVAKVVEEFGLKPHLGKKLGELSSGLAQRIQLAGALIKEPKLIIADEPTANLDPTARNEFYDLVRELNSRGVTFLISSHILSELERVIDYAVFISEGRVTFEGPLAQAMKDEGYVVVLPDDADKAVQVLKGYKVFRQGAYLVVNGDLREVVNLLESNGVKVIIARRSSLDEAYRRYSEAGPEGEV